MHLFRISCLLFIAFLTSIARGDAVTNSRKFKNSEDIVLSFKEPQLNFALSNNEYIIEHIKELQPNIVYYLYIQQIPDWARFVVVQTHVYLHNSTLKYNIEKVAHRYVTGQNVGLIQDVSTTDAVQLFLENENPYPVTALVAVVTYNKSAPIPGGCNMEFDVEMAPWLQLAVTGGTVTVNSQPAKGPAAWGVKGVCDLPYLHYQGYHLYLPEQDFSKETYFDSISKMLTVNRVQQNGRKVESSMSSEMQHVFSAYHGTGSVYAVVASTSLGQSAAYVPALTYTCSPAHYTDTCQVLTSTFSRSLCALVLFIGLFVCLFGHSFFQTELFLFSTLIGSVITYVLIVPYEFTDSSNVALSTLAGVTVGNIWLLLWWVFGSPLLSIFVSTLALGSLLASIFFYFILVDNQLMHSDANFWLAFVCVVLVVALLIAPFANRVNILACSLVGAYAAIVPIDTYIGGNLKYVFINTLRRATISGFNQATIDPPFQTKDGLLATIWVVLAVVGYVMQSLRFADRPPYPSRGSMVWGSSNSLPRTPLLSGQRPLLYGQPVSASSTDSVFT